MPVTIDKAVSPDIDSIYKIIKSYSDDGIVLERSSEDILSSIDKFLIARSNYGIDGVISYYDYGPELKEVRSLCVLKNNLRNGLGSLLLKNLINEILKINLKTKIFVLTYNTVFFKKNNFVEVDRNSLPEKIWKDCDKCKYRDDCGETAMVYSK